MRTQKWYANQFWKLWNERDELLSRWQYAEDVDRHFDIDDHRYYDEQVTRIERLMRFAKTKAGDSLQEMRPKDPLTWT